MKKLLLLCLCIFCLSHAQEQPAPAAPPAPPAQPAVQKPAEQQPAAQKPAEQKPAAEAEKPAEPPKPEPKKLPEDILQTPPVVYAVGNEYQIMALVNQDLPVVMWVEVNGKQYYDASNGVLRSARSSHRMTVPQAELNAAKEYTLCCHVLTKRKAYFSQTEPLQKKTYKFRPLEKTENIKIFMIADAHNRVKCPIAIAQYYEKDLDLLILNGDILNFSEKYSDLINLYKVAGGITNGEIPVVYARGNHEPRGVMAEELEYYSPLRNGYSYFTFRVGPVWGIALDCGEDKPDGHEAYGHTIACHAFRLEETEYLKSVIANADKEYNAEGVKYRLVVCHIPFIRGKFEGDIYREWCTLLRENVKPNLMLCGHYHRLHVVRQGDKWDENGAPCTVVIGSRTGKGDDFTGTAVELTEKNAAIRFINYPQRVEGEDTIEFK
ncbi:MAG: metallophosphoesterase [Victivallales bacterium]|nr:metallophosphoesterase [Victivallales bacterium]